jgi:glucans biosynthesis protein
VIDSRRSGPDGRHIDIVYRAADGAPLAPSGLQSEIATSAGRITASTMTTSSAGGEGALVLGFDLDPGAAAAADLRAVLTRQGRPASETWLYRWTR